MPDVQINGLPLLGATAADAVVPLQRPGDVTKGVRLDGLGAVIPDATIGQAKITGLVSALDNKQRSFVVDVRDFGALGTGSGDQTTAIQNAINSLTAGGVVRFPRGTYAFAGTLTIPDRVYLEGDGPYATVLRNTSTTNADFIYSSGTNLIGVRDMQLESLVVPASRTAGNAINFQTVAGYVLDNLRIIDPGNMMELDGCHSGWISRIKAAHGSGAFYQGMHLIRCVDTHISRCLFNGGTATFASGKAWFMFDSENDTIEAHDIGTINSQGCATGIRLYHSLSPASFAPRWVKVSHFYHEASSGVPTGTGSGGGGRDAIVIDNVTNAYFTNGYVGSSVNGITMAAGVDVRFHQVLVMNNWARGVVLSGGNIASFTNCTFDSNSQGLDNNVGHFYLSGSYGRCEIRGCYFGNAVLGRANQPSYAIENSTTSANVQVTGNEFQGGGALRTGVFGGSTLPYARHNFGYNPRGAVSPPAVPATTVAYTNAYGVDCDVYVSGGTVTGVAISGAATGLTSGHFLVRNSGTITLTYTVAPTWVWIGQ